jgi:hypothetical protein
MMRMKIINKPFREEFMGLCEESDSIRLCSPFVKKDVMHEIMENKGDAAMEMTTNVSMGGFQHGASDLEASEEAVCE